MRIRDLRYQGKGRDTVVDRAMPGGIKFSEINSPSTMNDTRSLAIEPASEREIEQAFRAQADDVSRRLGRVFGRLVHR